MKLKFLPFILLFISINNFAQLPEGFVYVQQEIPSIKTELRYFSENNFVGKPIKGYNANVIILTKEATLALKKVQHQLLKKNLSLKIFDAYRPQQAVDYFAIWATDLNDTLKKQEYYPNIHKSNLFKLSYIARKSGHSRGSTLDLTIVDLNTNKELDMGSPYDFFGEQSGVNYPHLTELQLNNRMLLQQIMIKNGFRNYPKEWWHFTLNKEPFKTTYFNFEVE